MYAIVQTGGKQLKVAVGDTVTVERLTGDKGAKVTLDKVLLVADGSKLSVGTPLLAGATVQAEIAEQGRNEKVIIFKKRRRQNYRRKKGHRQHNTVLKITGIKI
ncbi:MAG TPA: 50S ribosomal protein L21 [Alphaproteobacteria bacterium]|nr:50S ribosomal protein L21 [Alphaproteobacteria bacterium]